MAPIVGRFEIQDGRDGAIAQLGERVVRNDEVRGSIPLGSKNKGLCQIDASLCYFIAFAALKNTFLHLS